MRTPDSTAPDEQAPTILVVGAGARFYSGISRYTALLVSALTQQGANVSVLLARQLCPTFAYPGRERVGRFETSDLSIEATAAVCDTLDWWPSPGTLSAWRFALRTRPDTLLLQWWTATLLHQYLLLALLARFRGGRVVIEFHETLDVAEHTVAPIRIYARAGMFLLSRLADVGIVHSEADRQRVPKELPVGRLPLTVILLGHLPVELGRGVEAALRPGGPDTPAAKHPTGRRAPLEVAREAEVRPLGVRPVKLLLFGVLRAYKGLDVLAAAFDLVTTPAQLTVAGEPWDPDSRRTLAELTTHDRVTIIDRYLSDRELADQLEDADLVVLPYRRSAASGPLALVMTRGKPVVMSDLPSLREAAAEYPGALFARPGDPVELAAAIDRAVRELVGRTYLSPHNLADMGARFLAVLTPERHRTPEGL